MTTRREKIWRRQELSVAIKNAIVVQTEEFKKQASSLTFKSARRAIERELEMEVSSLDVHKKFVNRCLKEHVNAGDDEMPPEPNGRTRKASEAEESEETRDASELRSGDASNPGETLASSTENEGNGVSEDVLRDAIKKRTYFFEKSLWILTFMKVRRVLEEDLNLPVKSLDAQKDFINEELKKILILMEKNKSEMQKKPKKVKKKGEKIPAGTKTSKRSCEDDNEIKEEEHSEEVNPERKIKEEDRVDP